MLGLKLSRVNKRDDGITPHEVTILTNVMVTVLSRAGTVTIAPILTHWPLGYFNLILGR